MKKLIKSNKGVSLVELIIGIAILAVIGFAIATFMKSGTMSYSSTSKDVNLQYEAQLVTNHINDILTEANGDVSFDSSSKTLSVVTSERQIGSGSSSTKVDLAYKAKCIRWYETDYGGAKAGDLWYYEWDVDKDVSSGVVTYTNKPGTETTHELLAEKVQNFDTDLAPDVTNGDDDDIITVFITFSDGKKEFESTTNVSLRNSPTRNAAAISMPEPGPGPSSESSSSAGSSIQKVVVSPSTHNMKPGDTKVFEAKATGTGVVAQTFDWGVNGQTSADTKIVGNGTNKGTLVIGADETASKIYVIAQHSVQATKKGSAIVSIKVVEGVTVSKVSGSYAQNTSLVLKASVTGKNISSNTEDQQVTWDIVEGGSYVSQTGTNTFRLSGADAAVGKKVVIRATSVIDPSKSGTHEFVILAAGSGGGEDEDPDDVKPVIKYTEWPEKIPRGASGVFKPTVENGAGYTLSFEVEMIDGNGNTVRKGTGYTYTATGSQCTVNVLKTYDYKASAEIRVSAYLKKGKTVYGPVTKSATVEPVSVKINTSKGTYKTTIDDVKLYYFQGNKKVYYQIKGIVADAVDWKSGKASVLKVAASSPDVNGEGYITLSAESASNAADTNVESQIDGTTMTDFNVKVKPGNVKIFDNATSPGVEYWSYMPSPDDDDFLDQLTFYKKCGDGSKCYYMACPSPAGFFFYVYYSEKSWLNYHDYIIFTYNAPPASTKWMDNESAHPVYATQGFNVKSTYAPDQNGGTYCAYDRVNEVWKAQ